MNNAFHALSKQLKACESRSKLLKIVDYISRNAANLRLDEWDLHKLEQIGMQKHAELERADTSLLSNAKIGSKKYDGYNGD